jgi:hypothetical protein
VRPLRPRLAALVLLLAACDHSRKVPVQDPSLVGPPSPTPPATPCALPAGTGSGADCPVEEPLYQDDVEAAIDKAVLEHPEMVDTTRGRGCGTCYRVLDTHNFPEEVGRNLERAGYCTKYDGEELGVKKDSNDFNEQYDLLLAEGYIRRWAIGSYRVTCRPAWF